jgi:ubiquinone/menaquinone biosynthesis C-methylase UbiE
VLFYRCPGDKKAQNMTQSLHPAAQKGFSSAAELYQQVRPGYPQDIVSWLKDQLHLNENSSVVDLGAGTGKFLSSLQQITTQITAVEPVAEMLTQLKQAFPDVNTLQAFSNDLPLASGTIDAVVCAQSFHWFASMDTLTEIHRILKPEGQLGLIWNQRDTRVDWVQALAELIAPMEQDTPRFHSGLWQNVFSDQTLFHAEPLHQFEHHQTGTVEQVVSKRLLSTSFIAAMPQEQQSQLKAQFEDIVFQHCGKRPQDEISFPYVTYAYNFTKID